MKLLHLKNFITPMDSSQDLLDVIDNFIQNICNLPSVNILSNKLLLRQGTDILERELEKFKFERMCIGILVFKLSVTL